MLKNPSRISDAAKGTRNHDMADAVDTSDGLPVARTKRRCADDFHQASVVEKESAMEPGE